MKKLTSLQIIMLMGLALGSSSMYSKALQKSAKNIASLELQSALDEAATVGVLQDLAIVSPKSLEQIVQDVAHLEGKLSSIKEFVDAKNKEIEQLLEQKSAGEEQVAVLTVELADAQALFEKTLAEQELKNKGNGKRAQKHKQPIADAFMKAQQGLKSLNDRALRSIKKSFNSMSGNKSRKDGKKIKLEQAQAAAEIPGVKDEIAEKLAANNNISVERAKAIIDNTLSDDEAEQKLRNEAVQRIAKFNHISVEEARAVLDKFIMADDSEQTSDDVVTQAISSSQIQQALAQRQQSQSSSSQSPQSIRQQLQNKMQ